MNQTSIVNVSMYQIKILTSDMANKAIVSMTQTSIMS